MMATLALPPANMDPLGLRKPSPPPKTSKSLLDAFKGALRQSENLMDTTQQLVELALEQPPLQSQGPYGPPTLGDRLKAIGKADLGMGDLPYPYQFAHDPIATGSLATLAEGALRLAPKIIRGLAAKNLERSIPAALTEPHHLPSIPKTPSAIQIAREGERDTLPSPGGVRKPRGRPPVPSLPRDPPVPSLPRDPLGLRSKIEPSPLPPLKQPTLGNERGAITFDTGLMQNKKYIDRFVNDLTHRERIQADYTPGSMVLPKRVKPLIKPIPPAVPMRDLSRGATLQSPNQAFSRVFDLKDNPVIDAFEASQTYINNNIHYRHWANDVLKGIPNSQKEVTQALQPVFARHAPMITKINNLYDTIDHISASIGRYKDPTNPHAMVLQQELANAHASLKVAASDLPALNAEHSEAILRLAKQHPDVRIYLAAANELPPGFQLGPKEAQTAARLKSYMQSTRDHLESVGIPIIKDKAYMPRVWSELMSMPDTKGVYAQLHGVPNVLSFMSRIPGSRTWFPSAHTAMRAYIPVAEYKIAYQPFLNRWKRYIDTIQQPNLKAYMTDWVNQNMFASRRGLLEKGLNAGVGLEYARLIGMSLSVGTKHLLKLANTWAQYGTEPFAKGVYNMGVRVPVQSLMKRFGLQGRQAELQAYHVFVNQRAIIQALDEVPGIKQVDSILKKIVGQPVTAIEAFDNGVGVMAGIIKGGRKRMSTEEIERGIWDGILKANFRSGWDQPLWQKNPLLRAGTMFQSTPFKLTEFKARLIEGALKGQKDAFGTYYTTQLIRYALIIGGAEGVARANNTSLLNMFAHVPFVKEAIEPRAGFPYLRMRPLSKIGLAETPIGAIAHGFSQGPIQGLKELGIGTSWPYLNFELLRKIGKIRDDEVPIRYPSPGRYLLGLPAAPTEDDNED